ncbi:MAG: hypothetical protein JSR73_05595 [Proteobacteria bacterium]|nr:hypothetical protein [Pseudomonadota bacterium]
MAIDYDGLDTRELSIRIVAALGARDADEAAAAALAYRRDLQRPFQQVQQSRATVSGRRDA